VYYKSGWYGDRGVNDIEPVLNLNKSCFIDDYQLSRTVPPCIKDRLRVFLLKPHITNRIIELRKHNNYVLKTDD